MTKYMKLRGWGSGYVGRVGWMKDFNLPPQFSRLGIQGPASHIMFRFCPMFDMGFWDWFFFLSFFFILASMLHACIFYELL